MADKTNISWCDRTFNPWIGCTKVSPACDGCYAEALAARYGWVKWGPKEERSRTSAANWKKPLAWNREAQRSGKVLFVFCASLADIFDNAVDPRWRAELFDLMRATPWLVWMVLTKRPGNIEAMVAEVGGLPSNVALGCTVINQEEADRDIPKLLRAATVLHPLFVFLSMEPLLGPVNITPYLTPVIRTDPPGLLVPAAVHDQARRATGVAYVDFVITGGETSQGKHQARPYHPAWIEDLRDQTLSAGQVFQHKHNGDWLPISWMPDGMSDTLYKPAPKRRPEASRVCKVETRVIDRTGALADDYRGDQPMLTFKVGAEKAGRAIRGVVYDARPQIGRQA